MVRDQNVGYFEHALTIRTSAEVYGASLCAWAGESFAFDFGPDELDEALSGILSMRPTCAVQCAWLDVALN